MVTAHVSGELLPFGSVKLGRLVLDSKKPTADFHDPIDGRPAETEFCRNVRTNYKATNRYSGSSKIRSYLGDILSISYEKRNSSVATLRAPHATTYNLYNSESWFENACRNPETTKFLEKAIDRERNVYLVVGLRTARDANLIKGATCNKNQRVGCQAPVLAVIGLAPANLGGTTMTPGVRCFRDVRNVKETSFDAPGEQIFAILYRKVQFKWYSSKTIGNMSLEVGNRWLSCWDWRGPGGGYGEDDDDVLEATLRDLGDQDTSDEEYTSEGETDHIQGKSSRLRTKAHRKIRVGSKSD